MHKNTFTGAGVTVVRSELGVYYTDDGGLANTYNLCVHVCVRVSGFKL